LQHYATHADKKWANETYTLIKHISGKLTVFNMLSTKAKLWYSSIQHTG